MIQVQSGVQILTSEEMISAQKTWDDADPSKNEDFTACPFWLVTDDGKCGGLTEDEKNEMIKEMDN